MTAGDDQLPPDEAAIRLEGVDVELGATRALRSVSLAVPRGRFVGLVGPNGAGKTTLIRTVNGRVSPERGTVTVAGQSVEALSARAIGRLVATVPQRTEIAFAFPVRAVVEMGRFPHRSRLGWADPGSDRIDWAMERTEVAHLADRPVTETSGGEGQRVLLARALAQDAPILLLDEPTASLDVNHQVRTLSLVRELVDVEGRTAVAAIHDLDLAARFCDDLVLLADGRVRASGPPEAVLTEADVEAAFGTPASIGRNAVTGSRTVTALPARPGAAERCRVHVIGGGGRAAPLLHRLAAAGYALSIGVVHDEDPDRVAAEAVGAKAVTAPSFTPVDPAVESAAALARSAAVTVVADVALGPGNVGNLAVAEAAERVVLVEGRPLERRNHAGPAAAERVASLADRAQVVPAADVVEAVATAIDRERAVAADGGA